MTTSAPTPGAPEKDEVRSMFDRISPRYDLLNRVLSAGIDQGWRRACVKALQLGPAARVLDVCTGTADLLIEALGRTPGREGVGVDLSGGMLARGLGKLRRRRLTSRAALVCGDAERLPLGNATFDAAMVAFGIRNVGDTRAALGEMHRVLRPGGRLAVLEFSMPGGALGRLYGLYFRRILPKIGAAVSGDAGAYSYLPASVSRLPGPAAFAAAMGEAGFAPVRWSALTGGIACLHVAEKPGGAR